MGVFLYNGRGASPLCLSETVQAFNRLGDTPSLMTRPRQGSPPTLLTASHLDKLTGGGVLIMPGGRDTPYLEDIGEEGVRMIERFVAEGGTYMGFCAGAYFAASSIEFELGTPLEIQAARPLRFFDGVAYGTLFHNQFEYNSESGACACRIRDWRGAEFYSYYNGGCSFRPGSQGWKNVRVLARYMDIEGNPPACIVVKKGRGKAILSGFHPEISPEGASSEGAEFGEVEKLQLGNQERWEFMKSLYGMI